MEIAIIGGGITGLTTALALQKLGIKSKVYEQAPQLNEVGAGNLDAAKCYESFGLAGDWR